MSNICVLFSCLSKSARQDLLYFHTHVTTNRLGNATWNLYRYYIGHWPLLVWLIYTTVRECLEISGDGWDRTQDLLSNFSVVATTEIEHRTSTMLHDLVVFCRSNSAVSWSQCAVPETSRGTRLLKNNLLLQNAKDDWCPRKLILRVVTDLHDINPSPSTAHTITL